MFTRETSNVKREIERKFCPDQNWAIFGGFGGLGVRGFNKLRFLLQKARPCVNPRRLSHFVSKSVEGCDLQVGSEKKPESHRAAHRKDMSPLTQGLNYRSACDVGKQENSRNSESTCASFAWLGSRRLCWFSSVQFSKAICIAQLSRMSHCAPAARKPCTF